MTGDELDLITETVISRLEKRGNRISSLIPANVAEWLRNSIFGSGYRYQYVVPLADGQAMTVHIKITIDGEIEIRLTDVNGEYIWEGILKEMPKS